MWRPSYTLLDGFYARAQPVAERCGARPAPEADSGLWLARPEFRCSFREAIASAARALAFDCRHHGRHSLFASLYIKQHRACRLGTVLRIPHPAGIALAIFADHTVLARVRVPGRA